MRQTDKEIERLVDTYSSNDMKEILKLELERLVFMAEKQGMNELSDKMFEQYKQAEKEN